MVYGIHKGGRGGVVTCAIVYIYIYVYISISISISISLYIVRFGSVSSAHVRFIIAPRRLSRRYFPRSPPMNSKRFVDLLLVHLVSLSVLRLHLIFSMHMSGQLT